MFVRAPRAGNHPLKHVLTDPHPVSAIGNVYADEILHRGRPSPVALTETLGDAELAPLFEATPSVLRDALPGGDGSRLLTDRARSRLHKTNWPRTSEKLEAPRSR